MCAQRVCVQACVHLCMCAFFSTEVLHSVFKLKALKILQMLLKFFSLLGLCLCVWTDRGGVCVCVDR